MLAFYCLYLPINLFISLDEVARVSDVKVPSSIPPERPPVVKIAKHWNKE